jgi:hypothetical protein
VNRQQSYDGLIYDLKWQESRWRREGVYVIVRKLRLEGMM